MLAGAASGFPRLLGCVDRVRGRPGGTAARRPRRGAHARRDAAGRRAGRDAPQSSMPSPPQCSSVMEPARRLRSCTASPARSASASTTRPCTACRARGGSRPATSSPSTSRPSSAATWRTRPSRCSSRRRRRSPSASCGRPRRRSPSGIAAARAGRPLNAIGRAVGRTVGDAGFTVLRPLSGHGIGRTIHEPPDVLNYDEPRNRGRLTPGLVITIEPIISARGQALRQDADGWTVRTRDGSLTAHAEHTVVVTRRGSPLVLTSVALRANTSVPHGVLQDQVNEHLTRREALVAALAATALGGQALARPRAARAAHGGQHRASSCRSRRGARTTRSRPATS